MAMQRRAVEFGFPGRSAASREVTIAVPRDECHRLCAGVDATDDVHRLSFKTNLADLIGQRIAALNATGPSKRKDAIQKLAVAEK